MGLRNCITYDLITVAPWASVKFFPRLPQRFPIDTLKIDPSFVSDLTRSTEDETITATIITMGKSLDLTVVAEGVEAQEQLDFLRAHGCDEFQGYYAHKPMPADEFAKLLQIELDQLSISAA